MEECLAGNLSGSCKASPQVNSDGVLATNGCERFVKTYSYNNDNLIISEKDGRQEVRYDYYPNTALIKLKTILSDGKIQQRYYYEYDSESALTLEIIDDGSSFNINNLAGVSERQIKRIETTTKSPKGLPGEVSEYCFDTITRQEVLIKRTVNTFTSYGQLAK
ncbi:MAG: hypothetical protein ACE5GN_03710 [Waddliaceae bacterium]